MITAEIFTAVMWIIRGLYVLLKKRHGVFNHKNLKPPPPQLNA
jgi:hypothetical protein